MLAHLVPCNPFIESSRARWELRLHECRVTLAQFGNAVASMDGGKHVESLSQNLKRLTGEHNDIASKLAADQLGSSRPLKAAADAITQEGSNSNSFKMDVNMHTLHANADGEIKKLGQVLSHVRRVSEEAEDALLKQALDDGTRLLPTAVAFLAATAAEFTEKMLSAMDGAYTFMDDWIKPFETMCDEENQAALVSECVGAPVNGALPAITAKLLRFVTLAAQFKNLVPDDRADRFTSSLAETEKSAHRLKLYLGVCHASALLFVVCEKDPAKRAAMLTACKKKLAQQKLVLPGFLAGKLG
jgi:hypothetical protein